MAICHVHAQVISKSSGRSAVAAAAYRSASKLVEHIYDKCSGVIAEKIWDYSKKYGVVLSQILAPEEAPKWAYDREKLWNISTVSERRKDGQTAKDFDIALPIELTQKQNQELLLEIAQKCFVAYGMIADVNFHYDNKENPHAHIMLTTRELVKLDNGEVIFGLKNRDWNTKEFLKEVRQNIEIITNTHLRKYGYEAQISHLSHKDRGIDLTPTIHIGPAGKHMIGSDRASINAGIIKENAKRICENPDLIIQKISINKPVFTKEEIAINLAEVLLEGGNFTEGKCQDNSINKIKEKIAKLEDLELLNDELSREFMIAYGKVLSSEDLTLLIEEDLKGRTLYARTKRVELEKRFIETVQDLQHSQSHALGVNEERLGELNVSEKLAERVNSVDL